MRSELRKLYVSKRVYATILDYSIVWAFSIFYTVEAGYPNDTGGYTIDGWPALISLGAQHKWCIKTWI